MRNPHSDIEIQRNSNIHLKSPGACLSLFKSAVCLNRKYGVAGLVAASLLGRAAIATAATVTWVGATDVNWVTAANWGGTAPGNTTVGVTPTTDLGLFQTAISGGRGSSSTPVVIDSGRTIGSITFDTANVGAYVIGKTTLNPLYLSSGGTIQTTSSVANTETVNAPLVIAGANATYAFSSNSSVAGNRLVLGGKISGGNAGATVLTLDGTNIENNTVSGLIADGSATSLAITKNGTGTWVLGNSVNTFSGGITINEGALTLGWKTAGGTGAISIGSSGTLNLNQSTGNESISNAITGSGIINAATNGVNPTPTGDWSGFAGTINILSGNATGGKFTVVNSIVNLSSAATLVIADGGTVYTEKNITSTVKVSGAGSGEGLGALRIDKGAIVSGSVILQGDATFGSYTGNGTISGVVSDGGKGYGITKVAPAAIVLTGANTYSGGTIVSQGVLTVGTGGTLGASTGSLAVNNANTGAGTAVVLNLATAVDTTVGSLSGAIATPSSLTNTATINNGGSGRNFTVNQTSGGTYAGVIAGAGSFTLGSLSAATLTLSGSNSYTGSTFVTSGTLALGSTGSIANSSAITLSPNAGFDVSSQNATPFTVSSSKSLANNGTVTGNLAVSGTLSGSGSVYGAIGVSGGTINGTGLTVSGATTFNGAGNILVGTTILNGGIVAPSGNVTLSGTTTTSSVAVSPGATFTNSGKVIGVVTVGGLLNGTGTVGGALTLSSGAELAPGNGLGKQTVTGSLTAQSGAKISMQIVQAGTAGIDYGQIAVGGLLTLDGTLNLTLGVGINAGDVFTLIMNSSDAAISGVFSSVTIGGVAVTLTNNRFTYSGQDYALSYTSNMDGSLGIANDLTLAAVPEPGAWAMLAGGMGVLLAFRGANRRRTGI